MHQKAGDAQGPADTGLVRACFESVRHHLSPTVVTALVVFSALAFVLTLLAVPWFFTRIPADYYLHDRRHPVFLGTAHARWQPLGKVLRNLFGIALVLLGIVMLVLPGQGVLTIVLGLLLMDYPGKRRFEHWLVSRPLVCRGVNRLRQRAGKPDLRL